MILVASVANNAANGRKITVLAVAQIVAAFAVEEEGEPAKQLNDHCHGCQFIHLQTRM